jgi:diguanylate cyclase (GGDEF)-like protein
MNKKTGADYSLFDKLLYPILVINDKYDVIFLNASAKKEYLSDIPHNKSNIKDLKDQKCYKISHGYDKPCHEKGEICPIKKLLENKDINIYKINHNHRGQFYKVEASRVDSNNLLFFESHFDVSEFVSEIEEIKSRDELTGLLNFSSFSSKISEIIADTKDLCLLILLDIQNLTYINQIYGLSSGDRLLKKIGSLLKETFKDTDIIARLAGGEFGMLFRNIKKKEDAFIIKNKLDSIFKIPLDIKGKNILTEINAGAALFPDDGSDFKILYERAGAALFNAKKKHTGDIEFFNYKMAEKAESFVKAESLVDNAVKKNLFIFYYQPYFCTEDLSLGGFEALARIEDEEGRIYNPSSFIDYLESSVYLETFEEYALETVVKKIKKHNINISLNISGKSFSKPGFMKKVLSACYNVGGRLTMEITERVLVEDIEKTKFIINGLKNCKAELGEEGICENPIKIAMDDFGTGYSSLLYLKDLPIKVLKIDISFVRDIAKGQKERSLIKTIIELSGELGLKTIAEGVETQEQFDILKSLGCCYVQGFLLARPMPEEEAFKIIQ